MKPLERGRGFLEVGVDAAAAGPLADTGGDMVGDRNEGSIGVDGENEMSLKLLYSERL